MTIKNLPQLHPAEREHTKKLVEILKKEIEANGPISFEQYMSQALYHPEYGYYTSGRSKLANHQSSQQQSAATQEHLDKGEEVPTDGDASYGFGTVSHILKLICAAEAVSGDFITAPS